MLLTQGQDKPNKLLAVDCYFAMVATVEKRFVLNLEGTSRSEIVGCHRDL